MEDVEDVEAFVQEEPTSVDAIVAADVTGAADAIAFAEPIAVVEPIAFAEPIAVAEPIAFVEPITVVEPIAFAEPMLLVEPVPAVAVVVVAVRVAESFGTAQPDGRTGKAMKTAIRLAFGMAVTPGAAMVSCLLAHLRKPAVGAAP